MKLAVAVLLSLALVVVAVAQTQANWRWCQACQGLFFAGNTDQGYCPRTAGAQGNHAHDGSASGDYALFTGPDGEGQPGWRWCRLCQGLHYAANKTSRCPSPSAPGGQHDGSQGYEYRVSMSRAADGQPGWKWCSKCQGLFFSGNQSAGICPSGGQHDGSNSGEYSLRGAATTQTSAGSLLADPALRAQDLGRVPMGTFWIASAYHTGKQLIAVDDLGQERSAFPVDNAFGVAADATRLLLNRVNSIEARSWDGGRVVRSVARSCTEGRDLALDSKRNVLWMMDGACGYLAKVDPTSLTITASIPFSVVDPQMKWRTQMIGLGLAYDPKRDQLYASFCRSSPDRLCESPANTPNGLILVFDAQTGKRPRLLVRTDPTPFGLAYDPDRDEILVGLNYWTGRNTIGRFSPDGRMGAEINLSDENAAFQIWGLEYIPARAQPRRR